MEKAAGPTGVVSEMMKASGGFVTRWMTDLINTIVKEGCILDDWRKRILVPVYKGKGDKSKVMVGSSSGNMIVYSGKWSCGVCGKGVLANSVQCTLCKKWILNAVVCVVTCRR